jgi:hypothetical protein
VLSHPGHVVGALDNSESVSQDLRVERTRLRKRRLFACKQ